VGDTKRREFLKKAGLMAAGSAMFPGLTGAAQAHEPKPVGPDKPESDHLPPTPAQRAWMDLKFGMFIHFGINTYYGLEWSDGTLDPSAFNPTGLDTDEWCRTARNAGMKYIVLVTKHHDGFCLWPTALPIIRSNPLPSKET
jgi:alpha-L-fucosidase